MGGGGGGEKSSSAAGPGGMQFAKARKSPALWLMSFCDLSLILMCFFALQLSFSSIDKNQFEAISESVTKTEPKVKKDNLEDLNQKITKEIKEQKLEASAEVTLKSEGLFVELRDVVLFAVGESTPSSAYRAQIDHVLQVISAAPDKYVVTIEGHTDDTPISSGRFQSNWDLSSARAMAMMYRLRAKGVAESRMALLAVGSTRPKVPLIGKTGEGLTKARAANRRIVIRLSHPPTPVEEAKVAAGPQPGATTTPSTAPPGTKGKTSSQPPPSGAKAGGGGQHGKPAQGSPAPAAVPAASSVGAAARKAPPAAMLAKPASAASDAAAIRPLPNKGDTAKGTQKEAPPIVGKKAH